MDTLTLRWKIHEITQDPERELMPDVGRFSIPAGERAQQHGQQRRLVDQQHDPRPPEQNRAIPRTQQRRAPIVVPRGRPTRQAQQLLGRTHDQHPAILPAHDRGTPWGRRCRGNVAPP